MSEELFALCDGSHAPVTDGSVLSNCQTGAVSEMYFCAEAGARGWEVYVPFGHAQAADVCIHKPPGKSVTVQVKTAGWDMGSYAIMVSRGKSSKTAYLAGDFDVLAAYLPDRRQFVFWTLADLRGRKRLRYHPVRHRQPNNWELLDDVAQSLTNSGGTTANVPPPVK